MNFKISLIVLSLLFCNFAFGEKSKSGHLICKLTSDSSTKVFYLSDVFIYINNDTQALRMGDRFDLEVLKNHPRKKISKLNYLGKNNILDICDIHYDSAYRSFIIDCNQGYIKLEHGDESTYLIACFDSSDIYYASVKRRFRRSLGKQKLYFLSMPKFYTCPSYLIDKLNYQNIKSGFRKLIYLE